MGLPIGAFYSIIGITLGIDNVDNCFIFRIWSSHLNWNFDGGYCRRGNRSIGFS